MSIQTRLLYLFRTRTLDRELDEELSFHLETRIEQHMREGMNRADAEAKANREFGSVARAKSAMREVRVMKTSVATAVAAVAALSVATGTWIWLQSAHSTPPEPAYFQVTDQGVTPPSVVTNASRTIRKRQAGQDSRNCAVAVRRPDDWRV